MSAIISKLDTQKHKYILMSILLDISKNDLLKSTLVFKGGTVLFLLYNLDRFSTDLDLDFDLAGDVNKEIILDEVIIILKKYGEIKDNFIKRNTIFSVLSYGDIDHNIKIEISTRGVSGKYGFKNFMGIQLQILDIDYISSNKFIALTARDKLANRDIYDIHFILKNNLPINKEYIEIKTGISFKDYINKMIQFLEKLGNKHNILDGLGTTLDEKQKIFVKNNLVQETIFLLHSII
ncbi:MAG: nucleotidyl transferase AbiEii/AbiGii toxin family protein [Candidatus Gracilibacteria bacterium]|nr:nucleotidyl transferase AbiEii/AbiGii toxin family protein [Candidatus Gracilibacteria bacterium]